MINAKANATLSEPYLVPPIGEVASGLQRIEDLMSHYRFTLPQRERDAWRLTWPSWGELRSFPEAGRVAIVATNGILALFYHNPHELLSLRHVADFVGPVGNHYVDERDWDWQRNRRKIRFFRRKESKPPIIMPVDSELDEYWSKWSAGRVTQSAAPTPRPKKLTLIEQALLALNHLS